MITSGYTTGIQTMHDDPDLPLLQAIAKQDAGALEHLYARHGSMLLQYLMGRLGELPLAEEVLQDVMLVVWQSAGRFRGDSKVKTWLLSIAHRRAVSALRKQGTWSVPLEESEPSEEPGPFETTQKKLQGERVRLALRLLPQHQQETLELVFFHGLSGPETAKILSVSVGTIKSRLNRALNTLRIVLEEDDHA